MTKYSLALVVTALIGISCSSPTEKIVDPPPASPVFTGLEITYEDGRTAGTWETPADQPEPADGSKGVHMRAPAPNPFSSALTIPLELRDQGTVSVWVAREPRAGESGVSAAAVVGSATNANRLIIVDTLANGSLLEAGWHTFLWDGTVGTGPAPTGFYRIYIKGNGALVWCDVFLSRTREDMPEGLRRFMG